jgi:hypothetical protein
MGTSSADSASPNPRKSTETILCSIESQEWTQAPPYHQFDNIVINVVPEPDAWLLVGTGIGIAILFRKLK